MENRRSQNAHCKTTKFRHAGDYLQHRHPGNETK